MRRPFFALLRAGLWQTPADPALFDGLSAADWEQLYRLSQTQTVTGITFDGMQTLPPACRPPLRLYRQWAAVTARIEHNNLRLNSAVNTLFAAYREAGIHPVLLKGQGVATAYLRPLRRQCGDIDIYVGEQDVATANRIIEAMGAVQDSEFVTKHFSYEWDGVHVENHRVLLQLSDPFAQRYFDRLLRQWYPHGAGTCLIAGCNVAVPPVGFNLFYIFLHALEHILTGGIGLRQVCDWSMLLSACDQQMPEGADLRRQLYHHLRRTGLLPAARAFSYLAVHYLGVPGEHCSLALAGIEQAGEALLDDILASGNFGKYDARVSARPPGYWAGKWHTFARACRRSVTLFRYAPREAVWHPLLLIVRMITVQAMLLRQRTRRRRHPNPPSR
ncbi:MAG: nucleotidyltransferase family protein [Prevotellaceae bacterium]|jgi:hypothetical protein|nr:nucleotidyltransferase family protein [Prevotellaceae bacterium]